MRGESPVDTHQPIAVVEIGEGESVFEDEIRHTG